jgi:hypothetical protein
MRHLVVVTCLWLCASAARADGDKFAVLPTQGTGGVTTEAEMVQKVMFLTLQERSLNLSLPDAVSNATVVHGSACSDTQVACARLVGPDVGASKVVASELWSQMGAFQLRLVVVDVRSGGDPGAWQSFNAKDQAALAQVAEDAVLAALHLESFGSVGIKMEPGAEILVDGIARQNTPLLRPLELSVGRHELEVRYGNRAPWREFVEVQKDEAREIALCTRDDAVVECVAGASAPTTPPGPPLLAVAGGIGAGVGAVGLVVGAVFGGMAAASYGEFVSTNGGDLTAGQRDAVRGNRDVAVASALVGGALVVAGGAVAATSMVLE